MMEKLRYMIKVRSIIKWINKARSMLRRFFAHSAAEVISLIVPIISSAH